MNITQHVQEKLQALGLTTAIAGDDVMIKREPLRDLRIRSDEDWKDGYSSYKRARSINFDLINRHLAINNSVEMLLIHLSTFTPYSPEPFIFTDSNGNTVSIGMASHAFALSYFDSSEYESFFNLRTRQRLLETNLSGMPMNRVFWRPITATYTHRGRKTPLNVKEIAHQCIQSSLFKLAVEQHDCYSLWTPRQARARTAPPSSSPEDHGMPKAKYEESVVSFYKVAKASPFPSQSFLAYYHVLEFYFLRVSELLLHDRLTAMLNSTSFRANRDTLDKLISTIRGQDARSDETEMLRNVLDRFVPEDALIAFILDYESRCGEKVYSKKRQIFGEQIGITPIKDHAIANAAKALKHIRNAIVHSSDRYKREDCHIPLSASEDMIEEFIPLVRYFAEQVIFGTAS